MKKVLVLGNKAYYNETMYPHTYEVLKILEDHCNLVYFGGDGSDGRGNRIYRLGIGIPPFFSPRLWPAFLKRLLTGYQRVIKTQNKIKKLVDGVDTIIAIDHYALQFASRYLKENTRLIFWSLDYVPPDRPWEDPKLVKKNRQDIKKCDLIIIQDINRGAVLDSILFSHNIPKFYLPVSLFADTFSETEAIKRASSSLHQNITLMQLGAINTDRNCHTIINAYQKLPGNISLVMKGSINEDIRILIEEAARKPDIYPITTTFKEMREYVNWADIGIIACEIKDINYHFSSMASGQLVEFLRLGIPVIVLDMAELGEFVDRNKCGVSISDVSQLESAAQQIARNYANYSRDAHRTFRKFFDIELFRDSLINEIANQP